MVKQTTPDKESSNIIWNNLEEMVRVKVREFIQDLLEAEIEELPGRQKSAQRQIANISAAYRHGYGKELSRNVPIRFAVSSFITLKRRKSWFSSPTT